MPLTRSTICCLHWCVGALLTADTASFPATVQGKVRAGNLAARAPCSGGAPGGGAFGGGAARGSGAPRPPGVEKVWKKERPIRIWG